MADLVYITDGYWPDNYTTVTHRGVASTSSTVSVSASAQVIPPNGATLPITGNLSSVGNAVFDNSATLNNTTALSSTAITAILAQATLQGQGDISITGNKIAAGSATLNGVFSPTVSANAKFAGVTQLDIRASVSATGGQTIGFSGTLDIYGGSETAWADAGIWGYPTQEQWSKVVSVQGRKITDTSATLPVAADLTITAVKTAVSTITVDDLATVSVSAGKITNTSSTLDISASIAPVQSETLTTGSATLDITATQSAAGFAKVQASATLDAATTQVSSGGRIRPFAGIHAATSSVSATAKRTRDHSATLDIAGAQLITAIRYQRFSATLSGNADIQIQSNAARIRTSSATTNTEANLSANGGKLKGVADLVLEIQSTWVRAAGKVVRLDPYRKIKLLPESRTAQTGPETRKITALEENRLNNTAAEQRELIVLPESRVWRIQRGTPTIISTIPYEEERR
jgi:hypothetical protein